MFTGVQNIDMFTVPNAKPILRFETTAFGCDSRDKPEGRIFIASSRCTWQNKLWVLFSNRCKKATKRLGDFVRRGGKYLMGFAR
jgi:hypothetical protein